MEHRHDLRSFTLKVLNLLIDKKTHLFLFFLLGLAAAVAVDSHFVKPGVLDGAVGCRRFPVLILLLLFHPVHTDTNNFV